MSVLDLIIIGAGPAGMTAAIYAKRKGLDFSIISDTIGGYVAKTGIIENYPGFEKISGPELVSRISDQVKNLKVDIDTGRVKRIEKADKTFKVYTEEDRSYETLSIIIATGSHWRELGIPGEQEYRNKGVSFCTTCDAPLFVDMDVAVIGGGNSAAEAVIDLSGIASRIYMIVRSTLKADKSIADRIKANKKVTIYEGYVPVKISGNDFANSLEIKSTKDGDIKKLDVGGVFVEIGLIPNTSFVKGFVELNENGEVIIDDHCMTSIEGIFACGDVTDVPQKQIIVAAGEGAKAAMSAYTYVNKLK